MPTALISRKVHKWLSLTVGLQVALWSISGFYMVVMDLDFIHGDPLVRNLQMPLVRTEQTASFRDIVTRYPLATEVVLKTLPGFSHPLYEVTAANEKLLLDARDGRRLSPLSARAAEALARHYYAGSGEPVSVVLLTDSPPLEIQTRPLPLWRIDFDDWLATTLYVHPDTGVLVTRRHRFWRWFDFMWMLHIMDYDERSDVNNALLRIATLLGGVGVLSGVWLLYFSFRRRRAASSGGAQS